MYRCPETKSKVGPKKTYARPGRIFFFLDEVRERERIYSPKSEYAHVICDIFSGHPLTNEDQIFTTFVRKKKKRKKKETKVMHSLAPALTLTLTQTFSLNHLANKQLRSSHSLYSLINGSATDFRTAPCKYRNSDVICCNT